jgi:hypothetical protein
LRRGFSRSRHIGGDVGEIARKIFSEIAYRPAIQIVAASGRITNIDRYCFSGKTHFLRGCGRQEAGEGQAGKKKSARYGRHLVVHMFLLNTLFDRGKAQVRKAIAS